MKFTSLVLFILFCLQTVNADVSCPNDVTFASEVSLQTSSSRTVDLVLNGVGLRKVFFVKVFLGALYLEDFSQNEDEIINSDNTKVFTIHALRKITESQLEEEWNNEFKRLCGNQCEELRPFHQQFLSYTRDANKNERLSTVFLKDRVEFITEDGMDYPAIQSRAYGDLLLRSIIGPKPANVDFKKSVLGTGKVICNEI